MQSDSTLTDQASPSSSRSGSARPSRPPNHHRSGAMKVPNRIFVGGIAGNISEIELSQLFSRFGAVKETKIIVDREGTSKGFGFVTFDSEEEAQKALMEADSLWLKEKKLTVADAFKKPPPNFNQSGHNYNPNGTLLYQPLTVMAPFTDGFYTDGLNYYQVAPVSGAQMPVNTNLNYPNYQLVLGPNMYYAQPTTTTTQYPHFHHNSNAQWSTPMKWPLMAGQSMPNTLIPFGSCVNSSSTHPLAHSHLAMERIPPPISTSESQQATSNNIASVQNIAVPQLQPIYPFPPATLAQTEHIKMVKQNDNDFVDNQNEADISKKEKQSPRKATARPPGAGKYAPRNLATNGYQHPPLQFTRSPNANGTASGLARERRNTFASNTPTSQRKANYPGQSRHFERPANNEVHLSTNDYSKVQAQSTSSGHLAAEQIKHLPSQAWVPKIVNGVQILTLANISESDSSTALTPPTTPSSNAYQSIQNAIHG